MSTLNKIKPVDVAIGLGGNVGDVISSMNAALMALNDHSEIEIIARSSLYKTPPWGDVDQDDFINACAMLSTTLEPIDLLQELKSQEALLKRVKTRRWGPRTIDLDILVFGNCELDHEKLIIPHPRMTERAFVLMPLADILPDGMVKGRKVSDWLALCDKTGIEKITDKKGWVSGETKIA